MRRGTYQSSETRLDARLRCWRHYQIEEMCNLLKHYQLPGSRHLPWTLGSFTKHHRRYLRLKSTNEHYGTTVVLGLVQCLLKFCTQLRTNFGTAELKVAKWSTDSLLERSQRRINRPTNAATKTDHASSAIPSKINRYIHSGHQSLGSPIWLGSPTATTRRTRQNHCYLLKSPQRRETR